MQAEFVVEDKPETGAALPEQTDISQKTASGVAWRMASRMIQVVFQIGIGVILARLLSPGDFGIVNLAMIVITLANMLTELGLGSALIQREALTSRHIRTAFTLSTGMGLVVCIAVYAASPIISSILGDSAAEPVLRVLSLIFIIGGLGTASLALLRRQMRFRELTWVELASYLVGYGIVAITLALTGMRYWSLVYAALTQKAVSTILTLVYTRFRFQPLLGKEELKDLLSFSLGILATTMINWFALQGDTFIVGKTLGTAQLGLYARAYNLMTMPLIYLVYSFSDVLFPAIASIQQDPDRVRSGFLRVINIATFIVTPPVVLMTLLSNEVILGLYGPSWEGAVLPLRILVIFGIPRALYNLIAAFLRGVGEVWLVLLSQCGYALIVIAGSWYMSLTWGIPGVALAVGAAILFMFIVLIAISQRVIGLTTRDIWRSLFPGLCLGGCLWIAGLPIRSGIVAIVDAPFLSLLLTSALLGLVLLALVLWSPVKMWKTPLLTVLHMLKDNRALKNIRALDALIRYVEKKR